MKMSDCMMEKAQASAEKLARVELIEAMHDRGIQTMARTWQEYHAAMSGIQKWSIGRFYPFDNEVANDTEKEEKLNSRVFQWFQSAKSSALSDYHDMIQTIADDGSKIGTEGAEIVAHNVMGALYELERKRLIVTHRLVALEKH